MESERGSAVIFLVIGIIIAAVIAGLVIYHYISYSSVSSYNPASVATSTASAQNCKNSAVAIEASMGGTNPNPSSTFQPSYSYYYNTQNDQCYLIETIAPYYVNTPRMPNAMAYSKTVFDADSPPGKTLFGCDWYTPASSTQISTSSCFYFPNNSTMATMTWEEYLNMGQKVFGSAGN